jgi:AcrR family transcriptional regulator
MPRPARVSPDRILAAAAQEFAQRGYAGAGVDRIARRARVNKAMLYYHFGSKRDLYRTLLRQSFSTVAGRIDGIAHESESAADQIDAVVAVMAAFIEEHPWFPAIMLREVAEGATHLDRETIAALAAVPLAIGRIVRHGTERAEFRPVHPVAAYLTLIAPLALFFAGANIRRELGAGPIESARSLTPERFVRHLQESMRLALAVHPPSEKPR